MPKKTLLAAPTERKRTDREVTFTPEERDVIADALIQHLSHLSQAGLRKNLPAITALVTLVWAE